MLAFLTLLIPAVITLATVRPSASAGAADTALGYTWSLSLWIVPALAAGTALALRRRDRLPLGPFTRTVALLFSLGMLLDIAFGNLFFTFKNHAAMLGVFFWGYEFESGAFHQNVPIEEVGFYLFGIAANVLMYLWADRVWLAAYHRPLAPAPAQRARLSWRVGLVCVVVIAIIVGLTTLNDPARFPGYFIYLTGVAFIPASMLLPDVLPHVNWRAFGMTLVTVFLISLLWEATVAFPNGWWGYRDEMMLGVYIAAWNNLPLEEPFLWLLVTYTSVLVFEAHRVNAHASAPAATRVLEEPRMPGFVREVQAAHPAT